MDDEFWMLLAREENEKSVKTNTEPGNETVKLFESSDEAWPELGNVDQLDFSLFDSCPSPFDALDSNIEDSPADGSNHPIPSHEFDHGYSIPHNLQFLKDADLFNLLASPSSSSGVSTLSGQNDITNSPPVAVVAPNQATVVTSETPKDEENEDGWCDVVYTKFNFCRVTQYFLVNGQISSQAPDADLEQDSELGKKCVQLEPGTKYKFRIAAITKYGRGPWTESGPYKTGVPGFPLAPTCITISKEAEGARISWDPSRNGETLEYCVYLGSRNLHEVDRKAGRSLSFLQVYCGTFNYCIVQNISLASAYIFMNTQPAILFRIVAKNEKGYGPVTQVRWLQPESAILTIKRTAEPQPSLGGRIKKRKSDIKARIVPCTIPVTDLSAF